MWLLMFPIIWIISGMFAMTKGIPITFLDIILGVVIYGAVISLFIINFAHKYMEENKLITSQILNPLSIVIIIKKWASWGWRGRRSTWTIGGHEHRKFNGFYYEKTDAEKAQKQLENDGEIARMGEDIHPLSGKTYWTVWYRSGGIEAFLKSMQISSGSETNEY